VKGPLFNIPNLISLSRIPLVFIACLFLVQKNLVPLLVVIFLGVFSDFLDGIIARRTGSVSDWGKILDPLADKISIGAFIITMAIVKAVPLWFVVVFLTRDVLIAAGGILVTKRLDSPPSSNIWGKLSTLIVSVYLTSAAVCYILNSTLWPSSLVFAGLDPLGLLSLGFVMLSLIVYSFESVKMLRNL
jgi:CDP-diacylglycerol--glycerol-3-phosphate 3-phosphatidyltransferase